MKKTLSILLALTMALSMLAGFTCSAAAIETVDPLYYTIWSNKDAVGADRANRAVLSNEQAIDGDVSLKVKNFGAPSNEIIYYATSIVGAAEAEYTFSVDVYNNPNTKLGMNFWIDDTAGSRVFNKEAKWFYDGASWGAIAGHDGWYRYSWDITCAPKTFTFTVFESPDVYYVDNIRLVNKATGENVLKNGSFELIPRDNTIAAGTLPENWNPGLGGAANADIQKTVYTVVNSTSYDGSNALQINNFGAPNNHQYYLRPTLVPSSTGGDYTLTFKSNANLYNRVGTNINLYVNGKGLISPTDVKWNNSIRTDIGYGWYEYKWTFTSDVHPHVMDFAVYESNGVYCVDDFSLTKAGDSTNYIVNASFENLARVNTLEAGKLPAGFVPAMTGPNATAETQAALFSLVNDISYTGVNSLKLGNIGPVSYQQYYLRPTILPSATGGTYTLSVKFKGNPKGKVGTLLQAFNADGSALANQDFKWQNPTKDLGAGWYEYTYTFESASHIRVIDFAIYECSGEFYIDDISLTKDGEEYISNSSFEDIAIAEPAVTLGESADLGAYKLNYNRGYYGDGVATYSVAVTAVPFGRKAVITANGAAIAADTTYEVTEDTVVVVTWEDDGTDVLNELATAYEAEGEAAVFAKFNGTLPADYGFIIDEFVGKKFTDGTNEITDGKFAAANAVNGVFGIRIAGVEAGAYNAVPYAGEATADAIAFNIQ